MIDDLNKTMKLVEKLSAQVPITAYPGTVFLEMMKSNGEDSEENQQLEIERIIYGGDEGGILCALRPWSNSKQAYVVSITHLKFPRENPLWREIRMYQKQRTIKLSVLEGRGRRRVKKSKNKHKGFSNFLKN